MNYPMTLYMVKQPFGNFWWVTRHFWGLFVALLLLHNPLLAQTGANVIPPKPEPAVYVHDYAGWLSSGEKSQLEYKLRRYWDSTSTQIVVMIRPDLGDYDRASYAFELGNKWGIGDKKKNNGVVMLIKTEQPDRGIFIATGYGAEGGLTDLAAGRIIRNTMGPYFREQRYYQGIEAGINDIMRELGGEFVRDPQQDDGGEIIGLLFVLVVFLIIFLIIRYRMRQMRKNGRWYTNNDPSARRYNVVDWRRWFRRWR
jgi:uncharacterized protein